MIVPGSANPLLASTDAGGYTIAKSLRFRSSASANLTRTPASAGNRQSWTMSLWVKRGALGTDHIIYSNFEDSPYTNEYVSLAFAADNTLQLYCRDSSATVIGRLYTAQVFRDPSAWYHIVIVADTTNATSTDRLRMYINGSRVTSFGTSTYPAQNTNLGWNLARQAWFCIQGDGIPLDGYLAEVHFIDGQALTQTSFGETDSVTGVWKPKAYSGTYGTNGFYLKFTDVATTSGSNAGLGKDFSGNGNYWTTNNISVTSGSTYDSMKDVPTLTDTDTANYCVLNAVAAGIDATLTNGNLSIAYGTSGSATATMGTLGVSSGKWYCEITITATSDTTAGCIVGISDIAYSTSTFYYPGVTSTTYGYWGYNGNKYNNNAGSSYGATYTTGDVIGIAFDRDNSTLTFYKNGVSQGVAYSSIPAGTYFICVGDARSTPTVSAAFNFGQQPFKYTPPTGYKALNTYNLPDSTIVAGNKVMDATTYTGNGSTQSITNAGGFKPDLVWMKDRTNAYSHGLYDSVRGTGTSKSLVTNLPEKEGNYPDNFNLTAFNSNGFSLGSTVSTNLINANGDSLVAWQWQAGQGTTSSNTNGSVTSTVSANTNAGFSIITYTSNNGTVGHGLGVTPKFLITKDRDTATNWHVWHIGLPSTTNAVMQFNTSNAVFTASNYMGSAPTSTTFGDFSPLYGTGKNIVAYCWSEVAGFSKFGSYTGNGSADGPFIYTGFRPKFFISKRIDSTSKWGLQDTTRSPYNVSSAFLFPNDSAVEYTVSTYAAMDFLSNGVKIRSVGGENNEASGAQYIYMAFAESPFKYALGR